MSTQGYRPPTGQDFARAGIQIQEPSGPSAALASSGNKALAALAPRTPYSADQGIVPMLAQYARHGILPRLTGAADKAWGNGPAVGALATALPAGLLGYGGAWLWNRFADRDHQLSPEKLGLTAAVGGGALGAYAGSKRASAMRAGSPADIEEALIAAIAADGSLTKQQQAASASAIGDLSPMQMQQLLSTISMTAGAGVGMVIFRFLMGKGLLPLALGGLLGAAAGGSMFGAQRNSFGQASLGPGGFFG